MLRLPSIPKLLLRDARAQSQIVYPWELPSIMRKHILTGAMGTLYFVLVSGMYLVAFGNGVGMSYLQWGLLSGACSFVLVLQLASAYLVSRTGSRKSLWFFAAMAGRTLRIVAIAAAFVLHSYFSRDARLAFVLLLVVANCFEAIATPPWFSWLAAIIPQEQHGRFMGRRSAWIALANVWIVVPIGFMMDRFGGGPSMTALMLLFGFGSVLGIVDLVIHRTIPDPPLKRSRKVRFWHEVARPLRDQRFRPWLVFNALWTFGMTLGGSLATIYFVENLGIKHDFFGGSLVLILVPFVGTAVAGRYLGTLVDRHGVRRALRWGHMFWATIPLLWIAAKPQHPLLCLAAAALIGGMGSTIALNAAGKLITRTPPSGRVPMYVAVSACVASLAGSMGPPLAGVLLHAFGDASWPIGGLTLIGFHILFLASFILRMAATLAIGRIPEPSKVPS